MAIAAPRFGTAGNDTINGEILVPQPTGDPVIDPNYWQDELHGLGGNDTLSGLGNNDWLYGDAGSDTLTGGDGADLLVGGAGADVLDGGASLDTASYTASTAGVTVDLSTGAGMGGDAQGDTFISVEYLIGSAADDVLTATSGTFGLYGGDGNDILNGQAGIVSLSGEDGNDVVSGHGYLYGDDGDDILRGGSGGDQLDGGAGVDLVSYSASGGAVQVNLGTGKGFLGDSAGDTLISIENIEGSQGNDILKDSAGDNILNGNGGDDIFFSGDGNDIFNGGTGFDTLSFYYTTDGVTVDLLQGHGTGSLAEGDTYISIEKVEGTAGRDLLIGSNGDDVLNGDRGNDILRGGAGADRLDGSEGGLSGSSGNDIASYYTSAAGVTVNLANGTCSGGDAQGDVLIGIESVNGSRFNDVLTGNGGELRGWGGNDILRGGAPLLDGGEGRDMVTYWASSSGVTLNLQTESGMISIEDINGSQGNDTIIGNGSVNQLNGFNGNDALDGAGGHDLLDGGAGNDLLHGGSAMDQLTGGAGADSFIFVTTTESPSTAAGRDLITDFSHAQGDRIDLSLIDANTGAAGDQAFTYLGSGAFTGVAGQLHIWTDAGKTIISGDVNGDKLADFAIALTGILSPVAADFVL
ncbi:calcium-binding protein [Inquilinus sp. YAF38]|uniref:calcium-binding protein n=1 Tax=Inquilinus sp. YAF38 TaxID=3233084 RepID=UPI003F8F69C0